MLPKILNENDVRKHYTANSGVTYLKVRWFDNWGLRLLAGRERIK